MYSKTDNLYSFMTKPNASNAISILNKQTEVQPCTKYIKPEHGEHFMKFSKLLVAQILVSVNLVTTIWCLHINLKLRKTLNF